MDTHIPPHDPEVPIGPAEIAADEARHRLTDKQALAVIGGYFAIRQVTSRAGLLSLPYLLANAPWAIPLLNATLLPVLTAATAVRGQPALLVAIGAGAMAVSLLAGTILFWTGWRFGPKLAERGARPGSMWGSVWNPKQIAKAHVWIERWGIWAVGLARLTGRMLGPVVLVAGSSRMHVRKFAAAYVVSSAGWAALTVWLGVRAGDSWPWLTDRIKGFGPISARIGLIALVVLVVLLVLGSRITPKPDATADGGDAPGGPGPVEAPGQNS